MFSCLTNGVYYFIRVLKVQFTFYVFLFLAIVVSKNLTVALTTQIFHSDLVTFDKYIMMLSDKRGSETFSTT